MRGSTEVSRSGSLNITDAPKRVRKIVNIRWTEKSVRDDLEGWERFLGRLSDLLEKFTPTNSTQRKAKQEALGKMAELKKDTEPGKNKTASKVTAIMWSIRKFYPLRTAVPCSADPAEDISVPPFERYVELQALTKARFDDAHPGYKYTLKQKNADTAPTKAGNAQPRKKRGSKENARPSNPAKKPKQGANKSAAPIKRRLPRRPTPPPHHQQPSAPSPMVPHFSQPQQRRTEVEHDGAAYAVLRPLEQMYASRANTTGAGENVVPLFPLPPSPSQYFQLSQFAGNVECSPLKRFSCDDEGLDTSNEQFEQNYLQGSKDGRMGCDDADDSEGSDPGYDSLDAISFANLRSSSVHGPHADMDTEEFVDRTRNSDSNECHSAMHCNSNITMFNSFDPNSSFGLSALNLQPHPHHGQQQLHEQQQDHQRCRCQEAFWGDRPGVCVCVNVNGTKIADFIAECDRNQQMTSTSSTNPATQTSAFGHVSSHDELLSWESWML